MRRTLILGLFVTAALWALAAGAFAQGRIVVPRGTYVTLAFDRSVDLSTVRAGDQLRLRVVRDVRARGRVIVRRGTPVIATVTRVGARYGIGRHERVRLVLNPVRTVYGSTLALRPRGLLGRGTIVTGPAPFVRAGERLLAAVPRRTIVVAQGLPYGRRYGYHRGYAHGRATG